jgi:Tfp pilus assembly protein FimT
MRGATLLELLVSLTIAGILLGLVLPTGAALHDRLLTDGVTDRIVAAYVRARLVAQGEERETRLLLSADATVIAVIENSRDTVIRWRDHGVGAPGVTISGLPARIRFAPSGVTLGVANLTFTVARGGVGRQVVVSRYGRVRIQ